MVISIALLGYGASGTFLALAQHRLQRHVAAVFAGSAALFGISAVAAFAIAERLPFNALAVIWDPRQLLYIPVLYLLFTVPFFCGATCVGLALAAFPDHIGRIYRYDLVGAGAGALGVAAALFLVMPSLALKLVAGLALVAAAPAGARTIDAARRWWAALITFGALAALAVMPPSWTELRLALYQGAAPIDAVELNAQVVRLVQATYADFAGKLYDRPEVRVHVAEARSFVAGSGDRYDLIQLPLLDSLATAAAGTLSLS